MQFFRTLRKKCGPLFARLWRWEFWQRVPLRLAIRYINPARPRRAPAKIQIEPTTRCNLHCPTCSHARENDPGRHLTGDDLCRVLDRLPSRPARVILSGIGEPLMNPQFFDLVDILAARKIQCVFFTNGTLLAPQVRENILARSNIAEISISCDGARAETFESLRVGARFGPWKDSVRQFVAEAKQRRRRSLEIAANVVLSNRNLPELADIIRLTADLGFGSVNVMEPIPVDEVAASYSPSSAELSTIDQGALLELGRQLGLRISCGLRRTRLPPRSMVRCIQPWMYAFIRATGDVAPCCAVFGSDRAVSMGNLLAQDFREIWHGDRFREFRRTSAAGANPLCSICPYY